MRFSFLPTAILTLTVTALQAQVATDIYLLTAPTHTVMVAYSNLHATVNGLFSPGENILIKTPDGTIITSVSGQLPVILGTGSDNDRFALYLPGRSVVNRIDLIINTKE